ncbi:MAG: S41 family peptidase [Balneolaceae bacterium]
MKPIYHLAALLIIASFLSTACSTNPASNENEDEEEEIGEYFAVNDWIRERMDFYYFWNDLVPDETDGTLEPEQFFGSMLEADDVFSNISDDAEEYLDNLVGSSYTAGYSPAFYRLSENGNEVIIVALFVYPDTPADEAGLKRGDVILKINGQQLTTSNYLDLYYSESTSGSVTLGNLDREKGEISEGETFPITKQQLELSPIVHTQIYENEGTKTGYIFYSRFIDGTSDKFVHSLDDTLAALQSKGVTDLVIDLRYNPGGTISTAKSFGNAIAPMSATQNKEIFVKFQYNEELQQAYLDEEGPESENLVVRFSESSVKLGLDKIYFLTTDRSASASELLINGLDPYLDVVSIGTPTYGKFYGAFVITALNEMPSHDYVIAPVSLKYANALGVTDFRDGLMPDHIVEEDLFDAIALGDSTDPLLAKALELITGEAAPPAKIAPALPYQQLENPVELQKGNILFNPKKRRN